LLSKNLKIKIYRNIILSVVLYGCEAWSLILREEHRLRVFENWGLRRVFGSKTDEVYGNGDNYIMRSLMICTPYPIFAGGKIKKNEMGWACGAMEEGRGVHRILVGKPEGTRPDVDGRIILRGILRKWEGVAPWSK
jgi:hypothetical protein